MAKNQSSKTSSGAYNAGIKKQDKKKFKKKQRAQQLGRDALLYEGEGFGAKNHHRGDMADLGFDVVKHNEDEAIAEAMRVHRQPPDDNELVVFTDGSGCIVPGAAGGAAAVRVKSAERPGATSGSVQTGYGVDVVRSESVTTDMRPADCANTSKKLESQEVELWAILLAFRLKIFSDNFWAMDLVRRYREGDSKWKGHIYEFLLREILEHAKVMKGHFIYVKIAWAPGHKHVPGNEVADLVAGRKAHYQNWSASEIAQRCPDLTPNERLPVI
ncbi:reverse transcriptase [Neofusicoccum parvum]|nr:reverse transcriptase [Neofusicoccum parvum]